MRLCVDDFRNTEEAIGLVGSIFEDAIGPEAFDWNIRADLIEDSGGVRSGFDALDIDLRELFDMPHDSF